MLYSFANNGVVGLWVGAGPTDVDYLVRNNEIYQSATGGPVGVENVSYWAGIPLWTDLTLAHEIAHQWWGGHGGVKRLRPPENDNWLSEGFANYAMCMYALSYYGTPWRMANFSWIHMANLRENDEPLSDTNVLQLSKGALVPRMLQYLFMVNVSEGAFFDALKDVQHLFSNKPLSTPDFQKIMENHYGEKLDWFFDTWYWGTGYPEFECEWIGNNTARIQNSGTVHSSINITLVTNNGEETKTVWIGKGEIKYVVFDQIGTPLKLLIDKDDWVPEENEDNNEVDINPNFAS